MPSLGFSPGFSPETGSFKSKTSQVAPCVLHCIPYKHTTTHYDNECMWCFCVSNIFLQLGLASLFFPWPHYY